jgi:adenylate cyclase
MRASDGGELLDQIERRLGWSGISANLSGALDLFVFGALLLPVSQNQVDRGQLILVNGIALVAYMVVTLPLGRRWARGEAERLRPWLTEGRSPTPEERDQALRLAFVNARITAGFWALAAVFFFVLNLIVAPAVAATVPVLLVLGGITTATVNYLLAERVLRPLVARALSAGLPDRPAGPGVRGRVTIVWLGATGMPLIGIGATAVVGLFNDDLSRGLLAGSVLALAALAGVIGLGATSLSARALSEPLASVRHALERVEQGDLSAEIPVDDGSELGLVEAGFNNMAAGLRDRERMRDVFGRHVGRDVARKALDGNLQLGGEVREVGIMFVDLVGSTTLASQLPPQRVVALLNDFFALVVAVTEAHGGFVNKF